ncbi:hypothetical protein ACHAXS_001460 [Conticribra weissflogii]
MMVMLIKCRKENECIPNKWRNSKENGSSFMAGYLVHSSIHGSVNSGNSHSRRQRLSKGLRNICCMYKSFARSIQRLRLLPP